MAARAKIEFDSPPRPARKGPAGGALGPRDRELASLARALGHPARVAILRFLAREGECFCGRIVDHLPLSQATVSQHLKVLKDAGLLQGEVDGPRVCYCPDPKVLARLRQLLGEL